MKLYCNRYTHFKDSLVCAVTCQFRKRCPDFALFYAEHHESINARVLSYYAKNGKPARQLTLYGQETPPTALRELYTLEVKRDMAENITFIWIDAEDKAEVLDMDDLLRRAERGDKPKHIFRVAQEMELRFQLVPLKRIEDTKRKVAADAERAAARKGKLSAVEGKVAAAG